MLGPFSQHGSQFVIHGMPPSCYSRINAISTEVELSKVGCPQASAGVHSVSMEVNLSYMGCPKAAIQGSMTSARRLNCLGRMPLRWGPFSQHGSQFVIHGMPPSCCSRINEISTEVELSAVGCPFAGVHSVSMEVDLSYMGCPQAAVQGSVKSAWRLNCQR